MRATKKTAASAPALSLHQRMLAIEQARHAGRLEAIQQMHARLALLDAFMPAIVEAGIWLDLAALTQWSRKALWLSTGVLDHAGAAKLVNLLTARGMAVHERVDHGDAVGGATFYLKKGRLLVAIAVDRRALPLLEVPACA